MRYIILLLIPVLFACSPQKRLNRLIKNNPELVKSDTILVKDTLIVDGTSKDTIFQSVVTRDTVTIVRDQLTLKYYSDGKTVYLKGTCDTVKIIREIPVTVRTVSPIREVTVYPFWAYPALWVAILYIALTLAYVLRRLRVI